MRTLLIYPPCQPLYGNPMSGIMQLPFGIASLTSYLKSKGKIVMTLDLNIKLYKESNHKELWLFNNLDWWEHDYSFEEKVKPLITELCLQWFNRIKNACNIVDLIGFTVTCSSRWAVLWMAKQIKEMNPKVKIIFGGAECHEKNAPLFLQVADAVVEGEGEETLLEIADKGLGLYKGVYMLKDGEVVFGGKREPIQDLDCLPYPDYSSVIGDYKELFKDRVWLSTSWIRGCTNNCAFCYETKMWGKPRVRSPESIVDELIYQQNKYQVDGFFKADSTFGISEKWIRDVCDEIIQNDVKVMWYTQIRPEKYLTLELLQKMYQAGCRTVCYGVESGSQKILDKLNKHLNVRAMQRVIRNTKKAGIEPCISIMVDSPSETWFDFLKTLWFLFRNRSILRTVTVSHAQIAPFSDWQVHPEKYGIEILTDYVKNGWYNWRSKWNNNLLGDWKCELTKKINRLYGIRGAGDNA